MLPTPTASLHTGTAPRRLPTIALPWCFAASMAITVLPAWAQTAASTDKAQERSQQQSDNVYRWIKYFADQPKKVEPSKARPKTEVPQLAKKPEAKAPAAQPQTAPITDTATAPPTAQPGTETPLQQPAPQNAAAAASASAPAAPEPQVAAVTVQPLRPLFVVEPTIPREMRNEVITASVLVSFTVQQDGSVATPTVVAGNNRRLNRSAMDAIAQWRFEPIQTARATQIEFEFRQE